MQTQTPSLVYKLSRQSGYAPNKEKLEKSLLSHPDYPGFAAITDSLTEHSISCAAMQVHQSHLFQLTEAFITILKQDAVEQLVLVVPEANQFTIHDGKNGPYTCTAAEFLAVWSGNIIAVEKNDPPVSKPLITTPLLWLLLTASLLFALFGFSPNGDLFIYIAYYITALAGMALSVLLLRQGLGKRDGFTDRFCQLGANTDCQTVLQSAAAKLYKHLGLADAALVYFATQALLLLLNQAAATLAAVSLAAVLFTLYTLYQQKFVIKKWCPLCLAITAVVWLQTVLVAGNLTLFFNVAFTTVSVTLPVLVFVLFSCAWWHVKLLLQNDVLKNNLEIEHLRFRRNYHLFLPWYGQQPVLNTTIPGAPLLLQGNSRAAVRLTLLTNPLCDACQRAHIGISKLLAQYDGQLSAQTIFYVPADDPGDPRTMIAAWLYAECLKPGGSKDPLDKWFANPSVKAFDAYHVPLQLVKNMQPLLLQHRQWANQHQLNVTPTLLVNGRYFPHYYHTTDIGYFLDELLQQHEPEEMVATNQRIGQYE